MAIDVTDVVSEFGAFYIENGNNASEIAKLFTQGNDMDKMFKLIKSKSTKYRNAAVEEGQVIQPYQDEFTPAGDTVFTALQIDTFKVKVDKKFNPHNLEESYLGFLEADSLDPIDWPFTKWYLQEVLLPKHIQDLELNEAYTGVHATPTPGTPGPAGTSLDGVRKIINDMITSGDIPSTIATGVPDADPVTWVNQIEAFVRAIPKLQRKFIKQLAMSDDLAVRYMEGRKIKYNMHYAQESDLSAVSLFAHIKVEPIGGMNDNKIWCTPDGNAKVILHRGGNAGKFQAKGDVRDVKIWTDFRKGYGFDLGQYVYTNDQDLV